MPGAKQILTTTAIIAVPTIIAAVTAATLPDKGTGTFPATAPAPIETTKPATTGNQNKPPQVPLDKRYAFINTDSFGRHARWNPCVPITWQYNPANQPANALTNLQKGLNIISKHTGIKYVYKGTTNAPYGTKHAQGVNMVISWENIYGTTAGFADPDLKYVTFRNGKLMAPEIVSADVVLNYGMKFKPGYGKGETIGNLILHELAHTVGLDHVENPDSVMHPILRKKTPAGFNKYDIEGLKLLGKQQGCVPEAQRK